jgi:hypothetical protein
MKKQRHVTPVEIASHYSAAMDSVNLINGSKPNIMTDAEWTQCLLSNKLHLEIMIDKYYWTTEDLEPLKLAVLKIG